MGATIDTEVKAYFTANTTGLVDGVDRGKKKIKELQLELEKVRRAYNEKVGNVKDTILNPSGAAGAGLNKLVASLKFTAVTSGVLSAGFTLAGEAIAKFREEAAAARIETDQFNESYRRISQANKNLNGSQESSTLVSHLEELREQEKVLKQKNYDLNPDDNSVAAFMLHSRYVADDPLHAEDNLQRDQDNARLQLTDNQKTQVVLQRSISESMRTSVDLIQEQLQGSSHLLRVRELELARAREITAIQGTLANNKGNLENINKRYAPQIAAEKELEVLADQRFRRDAGNIGIERSLRTEEQKRVAIAERNLAGLREEMQSHEHMTQEARRALDLDIARGETEVRNARMESELAQNRQSLAQKNALVQSKNLGTVAKQYQAEQNTLTALKGQLAIVQDINSSKALGLRLDIAGSENQIRLTRQSELYGKSPSAILKHIAETRKDRVNRDRFDQRQDRVDGLISVHRDMSGNIIDGLDPITGEHRAPRSGFQQFGTSLQSGHVGDRTSAGGGPSAMVDLDPNGGLSGGSTPRPFEESGAAKFLREAPSAEKALATWRGDQAHDPAARLAAKSVWGDRSTLAGAKDVLASTNRMAGSAAAMMPKFSPAHTLSQAAIQLSAKKLLQEQATTAAVLRVESAVHALNIGFQ